MSIGRPDNVNRLLSDEELSGPERQKYKTDDKVVHKESDEVKRYVAIGRGRGRGRGRGTHIRPGLDQKIGSPDKPVGTIGIGRGRGSPTTPAGIRSQVHERVTQHQERGGLACVRISLSEKNSGQIHKGGTRDQENSGQVKDIGKDHFHNRFCDYCGNDILSKHKLHKQNNEVYHDDCYNVHRLRCLEAVDAFHRLVSLTGKVLWIGIHVQYLFGQTTKDKTKRDKRDAKVKELLKKVTALRNSDSGHILIHLVGLAPDDNFTGAFDEFADRKLQDLINDGSLFSDVYKKEPLSVFKKQELSKYSDILSLFVKEGKFLATSDIKTKLALDDRIIDIQEDTLLEFLRNRRQGEDLEIPLYKLEDLCHLQESRRIQTKAYENPPQSDDELVHTVFEKLRLNEYVSAFSKNTNGGSYFFGLAEKIHAFKKENYRSKSLIVAPLTIEDPGDVKSRIESKIQQTILICDYDGKKQTTPDMVHVDFISSEKSSQSTTKLGDSVLHIFVKPVDGVVFHDKEGPVAHVVDTETNSVRRVTVQQWFRAFKHRLSIYK